MGNTASNTMKSGGLGVVQMPETQVASDGEEGMPLREIIRQPELSCHFH